MSVRPGFWFAAHEVDEVREHSGDAAPTVLVALGARRSMLDLRRFTYWIPTTSGRVARWFWLMRPVLHTSPGASRVSPTDRGVHLYPSTSHGAAG